MRVVQNQQMLIGEVAIEGMEFDYVSRDDIPRVLRALQHIYKNKTLSKSIFKLLEEEIAPETDKNNGRPGMTLWSIFVCGVLRLDLNIDYDRLHELANKHIDIRTMLGHGMFDGNHYHFQTLKDNVKLLTPELLDKLNQLIVTEGHVLVKAKKDEGLRGRCDSFVTKTDVEYPTDINLLLQAISKVITLVARCCDQVGLTHWRQSAYNILKVKRLVRKAQQKNRRKSRAKTEEQKEKCASPVVEAHVELLAVAESYLKKAKQTLILLEQQGGDEIKRHEIEIYMQDVERQIDQIARRVIHNENIPHAEKQFSIFERHTEWLVKGKAGVPVELGVKICILEDQYQFILHHQVLEKRTDEQVALSMVADTKKRFPALNACSFDKGFHSLENQTELAKIIQSVILPVKGKPSEAVQAKQHSQPFIKARHAHSAVESAINALGVHGLDKCPDHGIDAFKRYAALAIVARNIHRIGDILWEHDKRRATRQAANREVDPPLQKAA